MSEKKIECTKQDENKIDQKDINKESSLPIQSKRISKTKLIKIEDHLLN